MKLLGVFVGVGFALMSVSGHAFIDIPEGMEIDREALLTKTAGNHSSISMKKDLSGACVGGIFKTTSLAPGKGIQCPEGSGSWTRYEGFSESCRTELFRSSAEVASDKPLKIDPSAVFHVIDFDKEFGFFEFAVKRKGKAIGFYRMYCKTLSDGDEKTRILYENLRSFFARQGLSGLNFPVRRIEHEHVEAKTNRGVASDRAKKNHDKKD